MSFTRARWLRPEILPLLRFALVGGVNTAIDVAVFLIGLHLGAGVLAANALGFVVGATNSFLMNSAFTFHLAKAVRPRQQWLRVLGFGAVTVVSLAISSVTVATLAPVLGSLTAKLVATGATLIFGFTASRAVFAAVDRSKRAPFGQETRA